MPTTPVGGKYTTNLNKGHVQLANEGSYNRYRAQYTITNNLPSLVSASTPYPVRTIKGYILLSNITVTINSRSPAGGDATPVNSLV